MLKTYDLEKELRVYLLFPVVCIQSCVTYGTFTSLNCVSLGVDGKESASF